MYLRVLLTFGCVFAIQSLSLGQPVNPLSQAPSKFTKYKKIRVHYKDLGKGKTALVLVHGWTCHLNFWREQVAALHGKARLILVDLPGHGKSAKPKTRYSMNLFAKAVNAVLQKAGVKKAVLIGHSMGTPVIRQFYRLYPKKTAALIAVDGSFQNVLPAGAEKRVIAMYEGPDYKKNASRAVDGMLGNKVSAKLKNEIKSAMLKTPQHVMVGAFKAMLDPAIWKDDKITVPVQAILAKSRFWTASYKKYVEKLAPNLDYRVMDGVGHFLMMERPLEFNTLMTAFLVKHKFVQLK